ncbi:MAG: zf-TFIIB domain-containing protein [Kiritimatiellae bacterium]|nr:zf-TFIIB domain-containing protein [Kiritimatiellia bacterium]MCO5068654.1 zf-TFIIB domain-containing protein [Kiritimatiellia bacterium]
MRICPHCEQPLLVLEYHHVEVDWCAACKGLWLDRGELGLILHGDPAGDPALDLQRGQTGRRRCPRCGTRMQEARAAAAGVTLDRCPYGHGVWFDAGEVQALVNAVDPAGFGKISDFCASLFGATLADQ